MGIGLMKFQRSLFLDNKIKDMNAELMKLQDSQLNIQQKISDCQALGTMLNGGVEITKDVLTTIGSLIPGIGTVVTAAGALAGNAAKGAMTLAQNAQMKSLNMIDKLLSNKIKTLETQIQALNKEQEKIDKAQESEYEKGTGYV